MKSEKKCLLIINAMSGNSKQVINNSDVKKALLQLYRNIDSVVIDAENSVDIATAIVGYDALAICGGDGTFNSAINAIRHAEIELVYIPCGTLNDTAHTMRKFQSTDHTKVQTMDIGTFNDRLFSYVAATGSFTPIGYTGNYKTKRKFKRLVYYFHAIKEYKLYNLNARINLDGTRYDGKYTLIMAVNSNCVFGLPFNRLYAPNNGVGQLLLIERPTGMFAYITMFFRFFRAFFIGFSKQKTHGKIKFISFKRATIQMEETPIYCVDGERYNSAKQVDITFGKNTAQLLIIDPKSKK